MIKDTSNKKIRKNPLRKRVFREIGKEKSKYIAIFLFIAVMIGGISGILVASNSMMASYCDGIDKYNMEDGRFELFKAADVEDIETVNEDLDENITVVENFYYDYISNDIFEDTGGEDYHIKVYRNRATVNTAYIFEGHLAEAEDEIAIDRLFAEYNDISIGDYMTIDGKDYEIVGFAALPDYSALFESYTDLMFNASTFTYGLVTDGAFEEFPDLDIYKCYSYTFDNNDIDDQKAYDASDELITALGKHGFALTDFIKRQDNSGINFTIDDMGSDNGMMLVMLYVMIILLAFIFVLIINSTIEKEASAIGTLRASGYTKGELLRHYISAPMLVSIIAAIVGNILGYSVFIDVGAGMYYHSYSLAGYETIWNPGVFILTTVVPLILLLLISFLGVASKLRLTPLQFLRHDLSRRKKKHVVKLPKFKFFTRFRLRVLIQNIPNYITMVIGIVLANILFLFAMDMLPCMANYGETAVDNSLAANEYILRAKAETYNEDAEKFCTSSLLNSKDEEISIFGLTDSKYTEGLALPEKRDEVIMSEGYMKRENLEIGDTITLEEEYGEDEYTFTIVGSYYYPAAFAVFMDIDIYNQVFGKEEGYFTGYMSDTVIDDIDEDYIATTITADDMSKLVDQLFNSMGSIMPMMRGLAVAIYILVVFLLAKIVLEKNAESISLAKILGYNTKEIGTIYIMATFVAIIIAQVISLPLATLAIDAMLIYISNFYSCWFENYIPAYMYVTTFATGIVCYVLIGLLHLRKISKIPMEEALKNAE